MWGDDAVTSAKTTEQKIVDLIMADCVSGNLDPGNNYPGARANRPNALKEHVESEVDYLLSRFRAQPTRFNRKARRRALP